MPEIKVESCELTIAGVKVEPFNLEVGNYPILRLEMMELEVEFNVIHNELSMRILKEIPVKSQYSSIIEHSKQVFKISSALAQIQFHRTHKITLNVKVLRPMPTESVEEFLNKLTIESMNLLNNLLSKYKYPCNQTGLYRLLDEIRNSQHGMRANFYS